MQSMLDFSKILIDFIDTLTKEDEYIQERINYHSRYPAGRDEQKILMQQKPIFKIRIAIFSNSSMDGFIDDLFNVFKPNTYQLFGYCCVSIIFSITNKLNFLFSF